MVITKEINLTQAKRLLKVKIKLRQGKTTAMIDLEATSDFITLKEAERLELVTETIPRKDQYCLNTINSLSVIQGKVQKRTIPTFLALGLHAELCVFDIIQIENQRVVLGKPWLAHYNLDINQMTGKIMISRCSEDCDFFTLDSIKELEDKTKFAYKT